MDDITQAIREQYEHYPYPSGPPMQRVATDARLLLSLGQKSRPDALQPIRVLDAGCGRGVGLLGCATLQPDVEFTGIDINRVALQELQEQIKARGLSNVRVQEINLMTLEGLDVPEGGYDVIYSSGVLHHLSDPDEGLRQLRSVLAPHGVISMMVYATYGRQPLYRLINAAKLLNNSDASFSERIAPTRELAKYCTETVLKETPWDHVAGTNDVEFVDLCLNANETSYSVDTMWSLLAATELKFLAWSLPEQWSAKVLPEGELRDKAMTLSDLDLYRLVEQVTWQQSLELVIGHQENEPREVFDANEININAYAVSPEVSFYLESKNRRTGKNIQSLTYKRGSDEHPVVCTDISQVTALAILSEQFEAFTGDAFVQVMGEDGVAEQDAISSLEYFVAQGVLYRPHLTDL